MKRRTRSPLHCNWLPSPGLYAILGSYLVCLYCILLLAFMVKEVPEVFLAPVVLGRDLQFWMTLCNVLWMLYFAAILLELATSGRVARRADVLLALGAIVGLLLIQLPLPVVFRAMASDAF